MSKLEQVVQTSLAARSGEVGEAMSAVRDLASIVNDLKTLTAQLTKVQLEQAKAIVDLAKGRGADMKGLFGEVAALKMRRAAPSVLPTYPRASEAVISYGDGGSDADLE